ncbi:MAG TPA: hypothetical protein VE093_25275 [Polyangiaceae bacterium]|jgi:hypothetical protein|nr:hypothetical protein [Polyangiaceae bacterium]
MIFLKLGRGVVVVSALLAQACVGALGEEEQGREEQDALSPQQPSETSKEEAKEAPGPSSAVSAPEPARRCDDLTNDEVLAAVYGGPKVPAGYYSEETSAGVWAVWGSGCGADLAAVRGAATDYAESSAGSLTGAERTTPLFHEVDIELLDGLYTIHYRKTRCDYFDGSSLAGEPSAAALSQLAVYLWYSKWAITGGYHVVLGSPGAGPNGERAFTLCETRTTFGDCGVCDEIALLRSTYTLAEDGSVTLPKEPELVRSIQGECDN